MTSYVYPHFVESCESTFSVLIHEFSFQPPVVEQIGRECFIRYNKGNHIVSIAYEFGCLPIVEFFYPSVETGEQPTPWAERNGIPYTRRIPRIKISGKFNCNSKEDLLKYLNKYIEQLISIENEFLN